MSRLRPKTLALVALIIVLVGGPALYAFQTNNESDFPTPVPAFPEADTPVPAPTPTSVPAPTVDPTSTPTLEPSLPTLPAPTAAPTADPVYLPVGGPVFPLEAKALMPESWPALPVHLYFIRSGRVWECFSGSYPSGTGQLRVVVDTDENAQVTEAHVAAGGRFVLYVIDDARTYVLDLDSAEARELPIPGTLEGRRTLLLSPDGSHVAFANEETIWLVDAQSGMTTVLYEQRELVSFESEFGLLWPMSWSPDSRQLLTSGHSFDSNNLLAMDVETAKMTYVASSDFPGEAPLRGYWTADGIWISSWYDLQGQWEPDMWFNQEVSPDDGAWQTTLQLPEPLIGRLWPYNVLQAGTGRIFFAQLRTDEDEEGESFPPGLYFVDSDGTARPIVSADECLLDISGECLTISPGTVRWAPGASAFVVQFGGDASGSLVGDLYRGILWDMRELLNGASAVQFSRPQGR